MGKKSLTIYPSEEQYEVIMKMLLEEQMKQGKKISVPKFIVDTFLPDSNGNSPLSIPDKPQEIVSNTSEDTILDDENKWDDFSKSF